MLKAVRWSPEEVTRVEGDRGLTIVAWVFFGLVLAWAFTAVLAGGCYQMALTGIRKVVGSSAEAKSERYLLHRDDRDEEEG